MSDPHGHIDATNPANFSEAEVREFHKSDIQAGGAIIVLMTAIFTIGLCLYSVVAIVVSRH